MSYSMENVKTNAQVDMLKMEKEDAKNVQLNVKNVKQMMIVHHAQLVLIFSKETADLAHQDITDLAESANHAKLTIVMFALTTEIPVLNVKQLSGYIRINVTNAQKEQERKITSLVKNALLMIVLSVMQIRTSVKNVKMENIFIRTNADHAQKEPLLMERNAQIVNPIVKNAQMLTHAQSVNQDTILNLMEHA